MDFKGFTIALIEPEIPPNTGNVARLVAATGSRLDLVGPLGFSLDEKSLRRAGLDYWPEVNQRRFEQTDDYMAGLPPKRFHLLSTQGAKPYHRAEFAPGDFLLFGAETRGLPKAWLEAYAEQSLFIPQANAAVRSLNLSNCCALVLYEALRQTGNLERLS